MIFINDISVDSVGSVANSKNRLILPCPVVDQAHRIHDQLSLKYADTPASWCTESNEQ